MLNWMQMAAGLLTSLSLTPASWSASSPSIQAQDFAPNPGQLSMYTYSPDNMPETPAPLIVLLPGCGQTAADFAADGDWLRLANQSKAYLILAQTRRSNNATACFNWFQASDNTRGSGEAASIAAMVDTFAKAANHAIDRERIFVVGFSAGAYMATALLASYPDVFAGGAILEGGAFRCASSLINAYACMKDGKIHSGLQASRGTPAAWGDLVRKEAGFSSYWENPKRIPRVIIWQGTDDHVVVAANKGALIDQWTHLHGLSDQMPRVSLINDQEVIDYGNEDFPAVRAVTVRSMGHAVAIHPGTAEHQGGRPGTYAQDVGLFSSYYIWRFLDHGT